MDDDKLMTDDEAAEYLGLSKEWGWDTLQKWVRKGFLKAGRVGKHYRFRKRDLDEYVFSKR